MKTGSRWRTVQPPGQDVGYYFIAPGRAARVEFGVEDTETIVGVAREYFRLKTLAPQPRSRAEAKKYARPLPEFLISPRSAGKVKMDMGRDEILRLFPPPLSVELRNGSPEIRIFVPAKSRTPNPALRLLLNADASRIVKIDVLDRRFRTETNLGPGSTFGDLLRSGLGLSLTQDSDTWTVDSAASCMTFQLEVDGATAARLTTEERIQWQQVLPKATQIHAVSLFAAGCRL